MFTKKQVNRKTMQSDEECKSDEEIDAEDEVSENNETSSDEETEYQFLLVVKHCKACKSISPPNNKKARYCRKVNSIT